MIGFTRSTGIVLILAQLGGCVSTTTTTTCIGPFCSESTETSYEPQAQAEPADDHTGTIIVVGAVVTAIALAAVLYHRRGSSEPEKASAPQAAPSPTVTYVLPPSANGGEDIRLQRMFVQAHMSARAGRCEAVTAIGKRMALTSPSYHERYVADPTIAQCLR